jgi:hypothetical protein
MSLELSYFYGSEAEQYSFYRIPKVLLTDRRYKSVSMEAKVLYGLMLDRMGLSVRNGWLDSEGRVYIYFTLEDALAMLGCGKDKAVRLFKELDVSGGIGLIERRKQGQGKPTRIYVKNFTLPPDPEKCTPTPAPEEPPAQTSEKPKSGLLGASEVLTSEIPKSALLKSRSPDCGKSAANKTDKNKTELSDTELSIHPPAPAPSPPSCQRGVRDRIGQMDAYRALIHENISYGELLREHPYNADLIDGYVELIVEVCCTGRETVRGNQDDIPAAVVRSRFLKLDREHILYVMESMQRNTTQIVNVQAYTLSALYNAPVTIGQYYTSQVSHDMAQGWEVGT